MNEICMHVDPLDPAFCGLLACMPVSVIVLMRGDPTEKSNTTMAAQAMAVHGAFHAAACLSPPYHTGWYRALVSST